MRIGPLEFSGDIVAAPLAGISDPPFRAMALRFGADAAFTEMIAAEGLARRIPACIGLLERAPGERVLAVQLFGKDPRRFGEAARVAAGEGADLVDINMGCPARKVVSGGSGAALLRDPAKAGAIVAAVRAAVALPVTVKIRAGWDRKDPTWRQVATAAADAGADAVTFHPRYREQGFSGSADWSLIADLVPRLAIPVIGNGDVRTPADCLRMKSLTGCAGVMIGRGLLGHPWLAEAIAAEAGGLPWAPPARGEVLARLLDHLRMDVGRLGNRAVVTFRKHLVWYTKAWPGISRARPDLMRSTTVEEVERLLAPLAWES